MKLSYTLIISIIILLIATSCRNDGSSKTDDLITDDLVITKDKVVFSFAFAGCNRVGWGVHHRDNPSMANHVALDSIFSDMMNQDPRPDLFFNLGDIVRAEQKDVSVLDGELKHWVKDSAVVEFTTNSGIEMVAVPGNHELLQSTSSGEYPLPGSTQVWLNYMSKFVPTGSQVAPDTLGLDNRASFAFVRDSIAFIVLNTDTFNPPAPGETYGKEGQFPQDWAIAKIKAFANDKGVKQIYALGHRPYYVKGKVPSGQHNGLPDAHRFWKAMEDNGVIGYLAAHKHDYQRYQHHHKHKTTQIIAGNAGSPLDGDVTNGFYGYSMIQIHASGKTKFVSRGYCVPTNYLDPPQTNMAIQDSATLRFNGNSNPLPYPYQVQCN